MSGSRSTWLAVAILTLPFARPAVDAPGFEIRSTLQGAQLVTLVSAEGVVTSQFADSAHPEQMTRQFIVRYNDQSLYGVDGSARHYTRTTLSAWLERSHARQQHILGTSPPISGGTALPRGATLRPLRDKDRIDGIPVSAYSLTMPGQAWRIWVATSLPRAPAASLASLAALVPVDRASARTLAQIVGYPVVRTELRRDSVWVRVLETSSIRRVLVKAADLSPPEGFSEATPRPGTPGLRERERRPGGADVPASVVRGPGPEMSNPELYVVLWGRQLNDPANTAGVGELLAGVKDMLRPEYVQPLGQYDIRSAKIRGVHRRGDLPPRAVGTTNFAAISAIVYDVGFYDGAPIFWWAVGGHDPLYVVLATNAEVDHAGWSGYHFVAFSLTHAVLPFPASLFAHDAIPWAFARIPDGALGMPTGGRFSRSACVQHGRDHPGLPWPPAIAAACTALAPLDSGTETISHELVETASDPFVFLGWSDPLQQPAAQKSEISDICDFNAAPWGSAAIVGQTSVSTYWSNVHRACVPESRPALTVFVPTAGAILPSADGNVVLSGHATDPRDGELSDRIQWEVDGAPVGQGATINSGVLATGTHTVRARVSNSRSLETIVFRSFGVARRPETVTITAPADGGTYPGGQPLVFRGQGFAFQPGDIPDARLVWDDGGTPLGTGPDLFRPLATPGSHLIRLSIVDGSGNPTASTQVTIQVSAAPSKGRPSVYIREPRADAVFPVDYGKDLSAPITFTALVTDAAGNPAPATVTWTSDVDGVLGTGSSITRSLSGGYCAPFTHRVTVTAVTGPSRAARATDTIKLTVGQVC